MSFRMDTKNENKLSLRKLELDTIPYITKFSKKNILQEW